MDGITVKLESAEFTPSFAKTCFMPAVPLAEKVAEKPPELSPFIIVGFVAIGFSPKVMNTFVLEMKLVPVILTEVPTGPLFGAIVIVEVTTVKLVEA